MPGWTRMARYVVIVSIALCAFMTLASIYSHRMRHPKRSGENLSGCGDKPNCVCSLDQREDFFVEPLQFSGDGSDAFEKLLTVLEEIPRLRVVQQRDGYIHATVTSRLFRFVDDIEFLLEDSEKCIHVRSASRVGYSDLSANRNRVNRIRALFNASGAESIPPTASRQ